jgi:hypothetical protein
VKKPAAQPYLPTAWEPADVSALQALQRGEATPDQQQRALDYLINGVCGTYDLSYRPEGHLDTQFAKGKRAVGKHICDSRMFAIAALRQGLATADQQRCALDYIVTIAGTYDLSLEHDPATTAFTEGKRFVGLQIVKALHLNLAAIKQAKRQAQSTQETGK